MHNLINSFKVAIIFTLFVFLYCEYAAAEPYSK